MLCLSRKKNESVVCQLPNGDVIEVKVTGWSHGKVKLAIAAPEDVKLFRSELQWKERAA